MPHLQGAGHQQGLYIHFQFVQAQEIGNRGPGLAQRIRELLMRHPVLIQQALHGLGLLHSIQVFTLNVLDQGNGQGRLIGNLANDDRNLLETGQLRGSPAALTRDDLELAGADYLADDDWLHHSLRADRIGKFLQLAGIDILARLKAARRQALDRNLLHALRRRLQLGARQQHIQTAAQPPFLPRHGVVHCSAA